MAVEAIRDACAREAPGASVIACCALARKPGPWYKLPQNFAIPNFGLRGQLWAGQSRIDHVRTQNRHVQQNRLTLRDVFTAVGESLLVVALVIGSALPNIGSAVARQMRRFMREKLP